MIAWEIVERAEQPGGGELVLARRGQEWAVRAGGRVLMTSRVHGSEEALAALALERAAQARAVLLGGLGMGFTLRATLDRLPGDARVIVAELSPALVAWNRGPLADLAGRPLEDSRVRLQVGDAAARIREARGAWDVILLDVDNGPEAVARPANAGLYGNPGIRACRDALRGGGVLAVWSAGPDAAYQARLERAGLSAEVRTVTARGEAGGVRHTVFLASKPASRPNQPRPAPARRAGPAPRGGVRRRPGRG
ncbi:MAG: hypothetical protein QM767_30410 [Anaeromyxobacter sp.]